MPSKRSNVHHAAVPGILRIRMPESSEVAHGP
jgi:hypothetical protein